MRKIRLLFVCMMLAARPGAAADETKASGGSVALFSSLERTAGSANTLSSDFIQEKHLSMFKTVLSSKGRFYFSKPDRLRWELTEPVASGFVLKGEQGRRWHQRTGRMKLVSDQLFAWARADFSWLKREYRISVLNEAPAALRLEPRSAATASFLHYLLINFSADGRYVNNVEVHERDGDFTRIRFVNTLVNKPLSADLF